MAATAVMALLLLFFPVKVTYGAGSLRCGSFVQSYAGRSMAGCAESARSNLRIALPILAVMALVTVVATLWKPRRAELRVAVAVLLYAAAAVAVLFTLMVFAMAP